MWKVSGPATASVAALKLLRGTSSYYHLLVNLPADYTGSVSIIFTVSITLANVLSGKRHSASSRPADVDPVSIVRAACFCLGCFQLHTMTCHIGTRISCSWQQYCTRA